MTDRHQFRAKWHEYDEGIYFVTIYSHDKKHLFGEIRNNKLVFSTSGNIVKNCILAIPTHHTDAEIWNFVVMPNHVHIVIAVGTRYHEHIIRNQYALDNIMIYIDSNVEQWHTDCFNN